MLQLLAELVAPSGRTRADAADGATDWLVSLDEPEVATVGQVLVWLAVVETDVEARAAQLHALAELADAGRLTAGLADRISAIPREELKGSSVEHYDYLRSLGPAVS